MMQNTAAQIDALKLLGALFYHAPRTPMQQSIRGYLKNPAWIAEWALKEDVRDKNTLQTCAKIFSQNLAEDILAKEFQALLIGPNTLAAPPWASVYLQEDGLLFGESTLRLIHFCKTHDIKIDTTMNEPPDHFGLLLWICALVLENDREDLLKTLLAEHLLPWSARFLSLFKDAAKESPFYSACASLATISLHFLAQNYAIQIAPLRLYR